MGDINGFSDVYTNHPYLRQYLIRDRARQMECETPILILRRGVL